MPRVGEKPQAAVTTIYRESAVASVLADRYCGLGCCEGWNKGKRDCLCLQHAREADERQRDAAKTIEDKLYDALLATLYRAGCIPSLTRSLVRSEGNKDIERLLLIAYHYSRGEPIPRDERDEGLVKSHPLDDDIPF